MIKRVADQREDICKNMRGGAGTVTVRHFFEKEEMRTHTRLCATLIIPSGAGIGSHQHLKEDEIYIVVRGQGMLDDGLSQTRVVAGDAVLTGNGESHAISNDGDEDLEIIAVIMCYGA